MAAELAIATRPAVRRAWLVLISSFLIFVLLLTSTLGIAYIYRGSAMEERDAQVDVVAGDVLLLAKNEKSYRQVRPGELVRAGDTIRTRIGARARLTFFDGSVTLLLTENGELTIDELLVTRFVGDLQQLHITPRRGWLKLTTRPDSPYARGRYSAQIDDLTVDIEHERMTEHEVIFEMRPREWPRGEPDPETALVPRVVVGAGVATIRGARPELEPVRLEAGQMAWLNQDNQPMVGHAAREFVHNGAFTELTTLRKRIGSDKTRNAKEINKNAWPYEWAYTARQGGDGGKLWGDAEVIAAEINGRPSMAVHFWRRFEATDNALVGIGQRLELPLIQFRSLALQFDRRIDYHVLSGGGLGSTDSEYPLIVKITYRDRQGQQGQWFHGFFTHNEQNLPTPNGEWMPQEVWMPYRVDLIELAKTLDPEPVILEAIDIYAEGHDFESYVANISIIGD